MDTELTLSEMGVKFDPRIIDIWLESEAKGGLRTVVCESCGKIGNAYFEPEPYGTVSSIPHCICSDCLKKVEDDSPN